MDNEKKYKEALERAKEIHRFSPDISEIKRMEYIFPISRNASDGEQEPSTLVIQGVKDGRRSNNEMS